MRGKAVIPVAKRENNEYRGATDEVRKQLEAVTEALPRMFPNGIDSLSLKASFRDLFSFELQVDGPERTSNASGGLSTAAIGVESGMDAAQADLRLGEKVPNQGEAATVGQPRTRIKRGTQDFAKLVKSMNPNIVFKDEEGTGADRMMTKNLQAVLDKLAVMVSNEWPRKKLRVTDAWDEQCEHGENSTHYEARAADISVSDMDSTKLGRLGRLAVDAGGDWVFYEDNLHIHVSTRRD